MSKVKRLCFFLNESTWLGYEVNEEGIKPKNGGKLFKNKIKNITKRFEVILRSITTLYKNSTQTFGSIDFNIFSSGKKSCDQKETIIEKENGMQVESRQKRKFSRNKGNDNRNTISVIFRHSLRWNINDWRK